METIVLERPEPSAVPALTLHPLGDVSPWLLSHQGLGMPRIQRRSQQAVEQAGYTDIGFRIQPRDITLKIGLAATNRAMLDSERRRLWDMLQPTPDPLQMRIQTEDAQVRRVDVHYVRGLEYASKDRKANVESYTLQFRAPEVFLRSTAETTITVEGSGAAGGMDFPLDFPMHLGGFTWGTLHDFDYTGSAPVYPTISLFGRLRGVRLRLTNHTGTHAVSLENTYEIAAGQRLDLRLQVGRKEIVSVAADGTETNAYAALSVSETFLPGWRIEPGLNQVAVEAQASGAGAYAEIRFVTQYLGL